MVGEHSEDQKAEYSLPRTGYFSRVKEERGPACGRENKKNDFEDVLLY